MATRNNHVAVNAQQRDKGGALPAGKAKVTDGPGDAKNRKALEDIGNLVNLRIADGKAINRPITSFGAQLLANAQAAGAANKNVLKQAALPANGAAKKKPAIKNTKPEVVIDITSPITDPKEKQGKKKPRASSSKRNVHSLTYVLSARSKVACGIVDIDAADAGNELSMVDYVEDLYKFYKHHEKVCSPRDYMGSQIEINAKMRAILVDWLLEVHHKFELMPETLYLTMFIIDRFLSIESVHRKELQLVGISAMLIASKYEEIWAPEVNDFICISDRAYTREQILRMEKAILNKLDWKLTFPTPYVFIVRFLKAAVSDKEMEHMTFFFAELALLHYSIAMHCPSLIAASAVYAARCTLNKTPLWSKTLEYHTGYLEKNLLECAKMMVGYHSSAADSKLYVLYRKYSKEEFGSVALKSPATKFAEDLKVLL
ncbi:G2/mitotic-specific cyclin S13-7-like isoform X2 [Phalaenopsis equestris]|uniref:G2/mitotic-specific cyclin S13-7-like isoform X2 n=1 Tax=Phalaenopsis equestris TaxID=78828 RepID=UPI0009E42768|nr:G2/mitotic-specific cyclin S13-7-like isoform X2 [Phalaenopsis equestris]